MRQGIAHPMHAAALPAGAEDAADRMAQTLMGVGNDQFDAFEASLDQALQDSRSERLGLRGDRCRARRSRVDLRSTGTMRRSSTVVWMKHSAASGDSTSELSAPSRPRHSLLAQLRLLAAFYEESANGAGRRGSLLIQAIAEGVTQLEARRSRSPTISTGLGTSAGTAGR